MNAFDGHNGKLASLAIWYLKKCLLIIILISNFILTQDKSNNLQISKYNLNVIDKNNGKVALLIYPNPRNLTNILILFHILIIFYTTDKEEDWNQYATANDNNGKFEILQIISFILINNVEIVCWYQ